MKILELMGLNGIVGRLKGKEKSKMRLENKRGVKFNFQNYMCETCHGRPAGLPPLRDALSWLVGTA